MPLNPPPAESATQPPAPGGFAALARRIGGWTGNLLATAIVLVASLVIGRQILHWWREDAPADAERSASADAELPFQAPRDLRLWTSRGPLSTERVRGDRLAALAAMRRLCSNLTIPPPPAGTAGPGER